MDKNKDIDKAACKKYVEDKLKDKPFKEVATKGLDTCLEDIKKNGDKYQKLIEITKEKCDVRPMILTSCLDIEMFQQCPKDEWTADPKLKEPCESIKSFLKDCYSDADAFEEFIEKQSD